MERRSFLQQFGIGAATVVAGIAVASTGQANPPQKKNLFTGKQQAYIVKDMCVGCGACIEVCPKNAVKFDGETYEIDMNLCDRCNKCIDLCPANAIFTNDPQ
jgi:ferredoxin